MGQFVACDVGGTFTDVVVLDNATGQVSYAKAPTVPQRPAQGLMNAVAKALPSLTDVDVFFHGTTLGINTVLEGKGAKTGFITTKGFRDILEIARMRWPAFLLHYEKPKPLVPRYLCREVTERMSADGDELEPIIEDEVRRVVAELLTEGAEAIAVCFLHAYAHPQHEKRVGEIIESEHPGIAVALSHEVSREYREYERASTTIIDATINKRMAVYIDELDGWLSNAGCRGSLFVTRCDGGVMSAGEAKLQPVRTLISGPASGVMGCVQMSRWLELPNVIGIDMGGTSFEASIIMDGEAVTSPQTQLHDIPLLMPVVELATIGAGGGSIAWIDSGGAMNVGPHSAGADPGPICYGTGGLEPTVTDAAVVSGLLDPKKFLGGDMRLDVEAARSGIKERIADRLNISVAEASTGIFALAQAKMGATLEEMTIKKGLDPRKFVLLAYGGGGPLVACALADQHSIPTVLVPLSPGTFSAWGALCLDVVHDFSATSVTPLEMLDPARFAETFLHLSEQAQKVLARERIPPAQRRLLLSIDMRYEGQEHVLSVPVEEGFAIQLDRKQLRSLFDARHLAAYGYTTTDEAEVTTYRVRAVGVLSKPERRSVEAASGTGESARVGSRHVKHAGSEGEYEYAIYDRVRLKAGHKVRGPAIIEEMTSTTVVPATRELIVDELGNLIITVIN
jgi:N-methylhydantoinase A